MLNAFNKSQRASSWPAMRQVRKTQSSSELKHSPNHQPKVNCCQHLGNLLLLLFFILGGGLVGVEPKILMAGGCESRAKIQPCLCQKMKMPCYWLCFLDFLPLLLRSFSVFVCFHVCVCCCCCCCCSLAISHLAIQFHRCFSKY